MPFTSNLPPLPGIANQYWAVAGNPTNVYSSASASYVPLTDATYQAWLAQNNTPTFVPSEADLWGILAFQYPAGLPAGNTAANTVLAQMQLSITELKALFWIVNQIRQLNSQTALTKAQFLQAIANLANPS